MTQGMLNREQRTQNIRLLSRPWPMLLEHKLKCRRFTGGHHPTSVLRRTGSRSLQVIQQVAYPHGLTGHRPPICEAPAATRSKMLAAVRSRGIPLSKRVIRLKTLAGRVEGKA